MIKEKALNHWQI